MSRSSLGAVAIGRNEGERLKACLRSLVAQCERVVYVDSGSTDGSLDFARSLGVEVVELDRTIPFTAARARHAGFQALEVGGVPEFVQFVDGDCRVEGDWLKAGLAHLESHPKLGLVTGWRSEIHPEASLYNAMFELDWRRPAGPIRTCGGDMMVRSLAYQSINGFRPDVIAAEDDDFCLRLGKAGWGLERLPLQMTWHDAAMTRFSAWWRRSIRDGHGFAQVGHLHPEHFKRERARVWLWGAVLPVIFLLGLFVAPFLSLLIVLAYLASWARSALRLRKAGRPLGSAFAQAFLLTISKFPNLWGMLTFYKRRSGGAQMQIIEYK